MPAVFEGRLLVLCSPPPNFTTHPTCTSICSLILRRIENSFAVSLEFFSSQRNLETDIVWTYITTKFNGLVAAKLYLANAQLAFSDPTGRRSERLWPRSPTTSTHLFKYLSVKY